jgi:holo-ACP synthase/triphosphoribosyl-dephospho-CoA synthase
MNQFILQQKEERYQRLCELISPIHSVITLQLNIPATLTVDNEQKKAFQSLFVEASSTVRKLPNLQILHEESSLQTLYLLVQCQTSLEELTTIKKSLILVEERFPGGRLLDLDIYYHATPIRSLSRSDVSNPPRNCFLCQQTATICRREQTHSLTEMELAISHLLLETKQQSYSNKLVSTAITATIDELLTLPKPGLVDPLSSSRHQDMNCFTFSKSIGVLHNWFQEVVEISTYWGDSLEKLTRFLRPQGVRAEQLMFKATQGINTHKGLIFSLGLLLSAASTLGKQASPDSICNRAKELISTLVAEDQERVGKEATPVTRGEKLFLSEGVRGIRGEAAAGFPSLTQVLLPQLKKAKNNQELNHMALRGMVSLIATIGDTNLMAKGQDIYRLIQQKAREVKEISNEEEFLDQLNLLDQLMISHHVSPGGTADLLACGFFLYHLQKKQ